MAYDRSTLERFALKAAEMTQQTKSFGGGIYLDGISSLLGIKREDARALADYLIDLGWMKNCSVEGDVIVTPQGHEEIAKLRRPAWRRWVDTHPMTMTVFWMIATSIVAGIIYTVITYHLLK